MQNLHLFTCTSFSVFSWKTSKNPLKLAALNAGPIILFCRECAFPFAENNPLLVLGTTLAIKSGRLNLWPFFTIADLITSGSTITSW